MGGALSWGMFIVAGVELGNQEMSKKKYLSVLYDKTRKPLTEYPYDFAQYLVNRFRLESSYTLLDAGCGRGEMLNAFAKLGLRCCGCDIEPAAEGMVACEIKKVDFLASPFPYSDDMFDVVLSKSVIEHLWDPTHYLSEIYRVLRPSGIFLILVPDWNSQFRVFYEDPTHVRPYSSVGVQNLLKLSGFRDIGVELFSHHQLIWKSSLGRGVARILRSLVATPTARQLTEMTGIKFFRWAVELQVLGFCYK